MPSRQRFATSRGYSYSYIHIKSRNRRPTLLLLHGWPSHMDDWIYQIRYFEAKGYGLVVPDLLGYGGSSNPSDAKEYRLEPISRDLAELLDQLQLEKVVGVGHDWGATILSRFAIYHPARLSAVAFLGIGASSPNAPFDLDTINAMTKKAAGMEMLGYITYITRDPTSQQTMEKNAEAVMDVMFTADPKTWDVHLRPLGGLKTFVEEDGRQGVGSWFPPELQRQHLEIFGKIDGYLGPSRYYVMLDENLSVPDEDRLKDFKITQPALLVVPGDPAASAEMQVQMLSAWVPNLIVTAVESGHWVHMERSDETNLAIEGLLEKL